MPETVDRSFAPHNPVGRMIRRSLGFATVASVTAAITPGTASAAHKYDPEAAFQGGVTIGQNAIGSHTTAALLVEFNDDPRQPFTQEQAEEQLFTGSDSLNSYLGAVSFGQLKLTGKYNPSGDVYDWIKLPSYLHHKNCSDEDFLRIGKEAIRINKKLTGKDVTGYDNYLVFFPRRQNCDNPNNHQILNGSTYGNVTFINSPDNKLSEAVNVHEFMHEEGISHANNMHCYDNDGEPTVQPLSGGANCRTTIYGDPFDPMGSHNWLKTGIKTDIHAINKARLGWLKPQNIKKITKKDTIVDIAPSELPSDQAQLIQIPYGSRRWVETPTGEMPIQPRYAYLEYRQPEGVDSGIDPRSPVMNGVTISEAGPIGRGNPTSLLDYTTLIDTNPQTPTSNDAPLAVGRQYIDAKSGITIKTLSADPQHARVSISIWK